MRNLDRLLQALVKKEKVYTRKILDNLVIIDKKKLYCDYGYPSLYKYLIKALGYTHAEAHVRVSAVKLISRDGSVSSKIESGSLSLYNAAQVQTTIGLLENLGRERVDDKVVKKAIALTENKSTREAKERLRAEFHPRNARVENLILDERILRKLDKVKMLYNEDLSSYEILDILLEERLKNPQPSTKKKNVARQIERNIGTAKTDSRRHIPIKVKREVYKAQCENCGSRRNLEYDHILPVSKGGKTISENLQMLCRNCNQRKGDKENFKFNSS